MSTKSGTITVYDPANRSNWKYLETTIAYLSHHGRHGQDPGLESFYEEATKGTIEQFEATGSPVITDGGQMVFIGVVAPIDPRENQVARRRDRACRTDN